MDDNHLASLNHTLHKEVGFVRDKKNEALKKAMEEATQQIYIDLLLLISKAKETENCDI